MRRLGVLWRLVVLTCGAAAARAVGLLAMLTNSLVPFAYEREGALAGAATVVGLCASFAGT